MAGFRKLEVWKRSRDLAVSVYRFTENGPIKSDYGLRDQIRRSSVSIPSNIAEGDERSSDKDSARFFYIAKGSAAELETQLEIAQIVHELDKAEFDKLISTTAQISAMLGALIKHRTKQPLASRLPPPTQCPQPLAHRLMPSAC